jgi:23S rRNA (pseudouridine1915-N3)-methyltransferase
MLKVNLYCLGKQNEKSFLEISLKYQKFLKKYINLNIFYLKESKHKNNKIRILEDTEKIKPYFDKFYYNILLSPAGEFFTTENLSKKISKIDKNINFFIGGPYGLKEENLDFDLNLSLSPLVFTHNLAQVVLLEQIFRVFSILQGGNYHK